MKDFIKSMLSDESGSVSSKRTIVWLIVITLIVDGILSIPFPQFKMDKNIIDALLTIAVVCLTGTVIDKFSKSVEPTTPQEKTP